MDRAEIHSIEKPKSPENFHTEPKMTNFFSWYSKFYNKENSEEKERKDEEQLAATKFLEKIRS